MKKIKLLLITFMLGICFITNVFAQGDVSISTSSLNITKGETKTFTITANNSAGRIDISSSNNNVVSVNKTSTFLDMSSDTIIVNANNVGNAIIKIHIVDVTTYDDENLSGKTYTINVNVNDAIKEESNKKDDNVSSNNISNNQNNISNNNANEKTATKIIDKQNNKSNNVNLKELVIEGYELNKIDDNNYTLEVNNSVKSINILAVAEDEKSKINGIGVHELNVGENEFNVEIVAEDGRINNILLKINRRDKFILKDLKDIIDNNDVTNIEIHLDKNDIISKDDMNLIKKSKKIVRFSYYDENDKLIYSWIIDGKKIEEVYEVNTTINLNGNKAKDIKKLSNYADGIFLDFKHNGILVNDTSIKLYVGDKFEDGNLVSVYYYNEKNNTLDLKIESIKVKKGYIEFDIDHCSNYFVTMSNLKDNKSNNVFAIIIIIELIIVITIMVFYFIKRKKEMI